VCRHTARRQRPPRLDHDCQDFVPEPATATLRAKHFVSFCYESGRELPLALFGPADDVAVSA
jgi:hypothetical protein